jgi:hypothetical protein
VRSALTSPKEYRDFAAQCLRWAVRAKSEEHKSIMLSMAERWMQTARELERAAAPSMNYGRAASLDDAPARRQRREDVKANS